APMTAFGTSFSPPRAAIAAPVTVFLSRSRAAASRRPAVAGSAVRSPAMAALRSTSRSAPPRRAAGGGLPATSAPAPGAGSSPAIAAAAPGRPRAVETPPKRSKPAGSPAGLSNFLNFHFPRTRQGESARRQHHHDLAAFELGVLFDLGEPRDVGLHLVEQLGADLLVGHLAAAIAQGDLHLVAFL